MAEKMTPDELARQLAQMSAFDISVFLGTFQEEMAARHGAGVQLRYREIFEEAKRDGDARVGALIWGLYYHAFVGSYLTDMLP